MKYLVFGVLYIIVLIILIYIRDFLVHKKISSFYFKSDGYNIDENYFEINNKHLSKIKKMMKGAPDIVYPVENVIKFKKKYTTQGIIVSIIVIFLSFTYSFEYYDSEGGLIYNEKKVITSIILLVGLYYIIEYSVGMYLERYNQAKKTNYYNSVFYKGLLTKMSVEEKMGIDTYAILPLGYIHLYFWSKERKGYVTKMLLNRKNKIAELYSGEKRKYRIRYFDLNVIENTDFLDQFISDLTFVENKVELKRLFNDVYFSDKEMIELDDYKIDTSHG